jgi:hypothetical protein
MREFFFELLNNLDKLAGLKQLDKIYAAHGEDKEAAKKEINVLLKVLCTVSAQFPYIPEADQQKIISQAVITEEFPSLNGSDLYKWLVRHKDKYFVESQHKPSEPAAEPVVGEARQKWLKEWEKSLANVHFAFIPDKLTKEEAAEQASQHGKEWASEIERKAVSTTIDPERQVYTAETIKERSERIRAMQEKTFRDKNPGASEEEVTLFLEEMKKYEVKVK